ncbi:DUF4241 domain-containing protein [Phytomonospora sp. NPDC050363]|uniref:DUF4241 domain-containing protein n=1 Tax=Phytomonospora sp. NPDC050363 TaxID=3155642 RepID=UPI0033D5533B
MSETPRTLRTGGFDELFVAGRKVETPRVSAVIEVVDLGELAVPTGRLAACDPMVYWELEPFTVELPRGAHPVRLSVVLVDAVHGQPQPEAHRRVAAAQVLVRDTPAMAWEMAVTAGQDTSTLTGDLYFGYGVDAGTGAFIDASGGKALDRINDADSAYDLDDALTDAGKAVPPRMGANVTDEETGLNVVVFPSGWGDGVYPTWIGRDAAGEVVSVVTDFHVL